MKPSKEKFKEGDPITWLQVHNFVPILAVVAGALATIYTIGNQHDAQNREINAQKTEIQALQNRAGNLEAESVNQKLLIRELQIKTGQVKGITSTRTPVPVPIETPAP